MDIDSLSEVKLGLRDFLLEVQKSNLSAWSRGCVDSLVTMLETLETESALSVNVEGVRRSILNKLNSIHP